MGPTEREAAPRRIVRRGWDRASEIYRPDDAARDVFDHDIEDHRLWLKPLGQALPEGARVLDLGCGCGVPDAALLAERFEVIGVDVSSVQTRRARRLVPRATFLRADMTTVDFSPASFDAVVCLYSLIHVPQSDHLPLLARVHGWLRRPGWLILIAGHEPFEGVEENWLGSGAPMYWSHADAATYRRWLGSAGFEVLEQRFVPEGPSGGHELFWARTLGPGSR